MFRLSIVIISCSLDTCRAFCVANQLRLCWKAEAVNHNDGSNGPTPLWYTPLLFNQNGDHVFFFGWPGKKLHTTNSKTVIVWNSCYDGPQILRLQSANITNSEVVQLKPPQFTGLTQLQIYCLIVTSKGWIACHIFSKMRGYGRYVNLPQVLPLPAFVGLGPCSSAPNGMLLFSIVTVQPTLQKTWADSWPQQLDFF